MIDSLFGGQDSVAYLTVDVFTQEVGVARVTGILFNEVDEDPPDVELLSVTITSRGERIQVGHLGEDFTRSGAGLLVGSQELISTHSGGRLKVPVGISLPVDARPGLTQLSALQHFDEPALFDEHEVADDPADRQ